MSQHASPPMFEEEWDFTDEDADVCHHGRGFDVDCWECDDELRHERVTVKREKKRRESPQAELSFDGDSSR